MGSLLDDEIDITSLKHELKILDRKPHLGHSLDEIDFNSLEPELKILKNEDIDLSTKQLQQRIDEINAKLTEGQKENLLVEVSKDDPAGYNCEKQILNITEVSFVDHVKCYNTTEEVCSLVILKYCLLSLFTN